MFMHLMHHIQRGERDNVPLLLCVYVKTVYAYYRCWCVLGQDSWLGALQVIICTWSVSLLDIYICNRWVVNRSRFKWPLVLRVKLEHRSMGPPNSGITHRLDDMGSLTLCSDMLLVGALCMWGHARADRRLHDSDLANIIDSFLDLD